MQRNPGILDGNAFKLGLFGPNVSGGLAFTTLPERWDASWDHNLALAALADRVGLECLVPVARWKGFGGDTDVNGRSLETITWACGLLAQTQKITIFGTVHVPMFHPIVAAKQMVTADQIGHGRFGLNIVCGWNEGEFEMFGVAQQEHEARYAYGEEWWSVVKQLWSGQGPVDHTGPYFTLRALTGAPGPYGGRNPATMNAGASPSGRRFAARNSDLHFDYCLQPEACVDRIAETKAQARSLGRTIQVWVPVSIICRPSQREAEDYTEHCLAHADDGALAGHARLFTTGSAAIVRAAGPGASERIRRVLGYGNMYSLRGDPDYVAQGLHRLHQAGFDGVALAFVNFLDELPYFAQEVLPRLERLGLRRPA